MQPTKAWQRVKEDIERYAENPVEGPRVLAVRANPTSEVSKVATRRTRKQKAASRKNIKKAQRASRKGKSKKRTTKRTTRSVKKTVGPKRKRTTRTTTTTTTTKRKSPKRRSSPKRRRKAAKRRSTKRRSTGGRTRTIHTERVRVIKVPSTPKASAIRLEMAKPRRKKSKRRSSKRRRNPTTALARVENPQLVRNPMGPFTADAMRGFLSASGGVAVGLLVAEVVDRYVATRTPAEAGGRKGIQPWYGRDAAAAQQRRPGAMRLGVQAGGAVAAILGTYAARNVKILPWVLGGTAVGFGANLFMKLAQWYLLPAVFKVENPGEATLANRLFPLEQSNVQDVIDAAFENWPQVTTLQEAQVTEGVGIQSPLGSPGGGPLYVLGATPKGKTGPLGEAARNPAGRGELLMTGRVGSCESCGGNGGCYSTCSDLMNGKALKCRYVVQPGDDLALMANAANVDVMSVNSLNGGQSPASYWVPGSQVTLPYALCKYVSGKTPSASYPTPGGGSFTPTYSPAQQKAWNGNGGDPGGDTVVEMMDVAGPPAKPQYRGFNPRDDED